MWKWPREPCGAPERSSRWSPPPYVSVALAPLQPRRTIRRRRWSSSPPSLSASYATPSPPPPSSSVGLELSILDYFALFFFYIWNLIFFARFLSDYEYSLWGLDEGSVEKSKVKHEVHLRSARKLEELCFRNGGIYIKLGQHVGQLVCSHQF